MMPARIYGDEREAIEAFLQEFAPLFAWIDADALRQAHIGSFVKPGQCWDDCALTFSSIGLGPADRAQWCPGKMKLDGE